MTSCDFIRDGNFAFINYGAQTSVGLGYGFLNSMFSSRMINLNPSAPHATGYRYLSFVVVENTIYCYYQFKNTDESEDLVVKKIDLN